MPSIHGGTHATILGVRSSKAYLKEWRPRQASLSPRNGLGVMAPERNVVNTGIGKVSVSGVTIPDGAWVIDGLFSCLKRRVETLPHLGSVGRADQSRVLT